MNNRECMHPQRRVKNLMPLQVGASGFLLPVKKKLALVLNFIPKRFMENKDDNISVILPTAFDLSNE